MVEHVPIEKAKATRGLGLVPTSIPGPPWTSAAKDEGEPVVDRDSDPKPTA
jgi:hypothetical protein